MRSIAVAAVSAGCVAWVLLSAWNGIADTSASVGADVERALWLVPGLVALHLTQLLLAALAWRCLFADPRPGAATFYRLRLVREGIDSLLPAVQIGGEFVGAQLLSRRGIPLGRAGASVIVDVTVEVLTQVLFLLAGLGALVCLSRLSDWGVWTEAVLAGGVLTGGFFLAQRFGLLRVMEALLRRIAERWPSLAGTSLAGLNRYALDFYRQPRAMGTCVLLHLLAWFMGTAETWMVLHVLGMPVSLLQALTIESLGMAGRSAGFFVPGALGVQEGGFVLAAMAVGLPVAPALSLSLIKRIRELTVGLIGVALWRWPVRRPAA